MYLVVTVTVDCHQIAQGVIPALLIAMMYFQKRLWQEDEVAVATTSVLGEQDRDPARDTRVVAASRGPIAPVTIEGACRSFHFAVPNNRHGRVVVKHRPFGPKAPAFPLLSVPVLLSDPSSSLMGVTEACPARQSQIEEVIQALEAGFADHGPIVLAPADNHRVELPNQMVLTRGSILTDDRAELGIVALIAARLGLMRVLRPSLALW